MGWIISLIVGGIIGWLASIVMKTNAQMGLVWNVVVGIVGSMLGRWLFADILRIGGAYRAGSFSISGLLFGVLGAVLLIFILKKLNVFKTDAE